MRAKRHGKVTVRIDNAIVEMRKVVDLVEAFGSDHGLPQNVTNELNLCLDEILNNTISYGYDDRKRHSILVTLSLEGNVLLAEVQDDGRPFDPRRSAPVELEGDLHGRRMGGLGLYFVQSLMDEVDYVRAGQYNQLRLKKNIVELQGNRT